MSSVQTSAPPAAISAAERDYWHSTALEFAKLDCCLLNLLPWEDRTLSKLPGHVHGVLLKRLDELVTDACRCEREYPQKRQKATGQVLNAAIWNFLKAWRREAAQPNQPDTAKGTTP